MNWLDWVIIFIVALSALQGLRFGLVTSVARLAGFIAGLVVAFSYYRPLAEYLTQHWKMTEIIMPAVREFLKLWLPAGEKLPPGLPEGKITSAQVIQNQINSISEQLAGRLAGGVLEVLSFLVLLAATAWLINLAGLLVTKAVRISLLGPLDHLGGFFFGAVKGLIMVMLLVILISPFQRSDYQPSHPLARGKTFQDSKLLPYLNPLFEAVGRPLPAAPPGDERNSRILDA